MSPLGRITLSPLSLAPTSHMRKKRPGHILEEPERESSATPDPCGYPSEIEALSTGLASLHFEEFTWDDGNGGYKGVSAAQLGRLYDYLRMMYPMVGSLWERVPYLIVYCDGSVPRPSERPLIIAGLLGIWVEFGSDNFAPEIMGAEAGNVGKHFAVDDDIMEDIRHYHIPKTETMCRLLRKDFPNALALNFMTDEFIVELPELPIKEHIERLKTLPYFFGHCRLPVIRYHNGLRIAGHENKRLKQQIPERVEGQYNDSDYAASQGTFQPGSMLATDRGHSMSAGILVEKGDERRLTVATHCWQDELDESPGRMGNPQFFNVTQGKTHVGHVISRMESTDIGLATLKDTVKFDNQFLDLPGGPTRLLHSDELKSKDVYVIDSFTTGQQRAFVYQGKRVVIQTQEDTTDRGASTILIQGIFAAGNPISNSVIGEGCCGSALVRLDKATPGSSASKESTPGSTLGFVNTGEIGGFIHWSNFERGTSDHPSWFCYAEVTDPLIDAGWEVARDVN